MLLEPDRWSLAFRSDEVLAALPAELRDRVTLETHAAVMEIATGVHRRIGDAVTELVQLRERVARALPAQGLRAAVAGTHPCAQAGDTVLSSHPRYRQIGDSMRVLARREPTLATHVHVGVSSSDRAIRLLNRLRAHLPLLLALSANSPFWQGRHTGFASTRTTLFDAFPRSGLPRGFRDYADWVATVERLLRSGAIPDPSFLWWDVRLQPRYGTVEVRRGRGCGRRARPDARERRAGAARRSRARADPRADRGEPLPGRARRHGGAADRCALGPARPGDRAA